MMISLRKVVKKLSDSQKGHFKWQALVSHMASMRSNRKPHNLMYRLLLSIYKDRESIKHRSLRQIVWIESLLDYKKGPYRFNVWD